jgi:hypothetical protein
MGEDDGIPLFFKFQDLLFCGLISPVAHIVIYFPRFSPYSIYLVTLGCHS